MAMKGTVTTIMILRNVVMTEIIVIARITTITTLTTKSTSFIIMAALFTDTG